MCSVCEITLLILVVNQQGDNKKMEDAKCYLTLPYTKVEMEEKETPSGKSLHHLANFTPNKDSTKDSFQIATLICSTKLTRNGRSCINIPVVSHCVFEFRRAVSFCRCLWHWGTCELTALTLILLLHASMTAQSQHCWHQYGSYLPFRVPALKQTRSRAQEKSYTLINVLA